MSSLHKNVPDKVFEEAFTQKNSLKNCISNIDKLSKSIKSQFRQDNMDAYVYEDQINTLTCVRLFLELYGEGLYPVPVAMGVYVHENA